MARSEIKPAAIREFNWPFAGLDGAYAGVVEHVGIVLAGAADTNKNTNKLLGYQGMITDGRELINETND